MGAARVSVGPELPSAAGGTEAGVPPPHPVGTIVCVRADRICPFAWPTLLTSVMSVSSVLLSFFMLFKKKKFTYLAGLGLHCSTWEVSFQHANSNVI